MLSPIHEIVDRTHADNHLFVMREDLLPFSLGGNKVRIAQAFLDDMAKRGCDTMVAYGNARSNLCRVMANRCRQLGIPCYIICSTSEDEAGLETTNSRLMAFLGAEMVPCLVSDIAETVEGLMSRLRAEGRRPYYIYGDKFGRGNEGVAASAYARLYPELLAHEHAAGTGFDYIFLPSGTGSTQAGLTCGHLIAGDATKVVGILISSRTPERARSIIETGMESYLAGAAPKLAGGIADALRLECGFTRGGYGAYDDEILRCIKEEFELNGMPLDPTYTGKAFLGMEEVIRRDGITGARILFVHTGGTPLFYDCLASGALERVS